MLARLTTFSCFAALGTHAVDSRHQPTRASAATDNVVSMEFSGMESAEELGRMNAHIGLANGNPTGRNVDPESNDVKLAMHNAGMNHNVDQNLEEGLNGGAFAEDSWDGLGLADAALSFTQMGMEKKRHHHGRHHHGNHHHAHEHSQGIITASADAASPTAERSGSSFIQEKSGVRIQESKKKRRMLRRGDEDAMPTLGAMFLQEGAESHHKHRHGHGHHHHHEAEKDSSFVEHGASSSHEKQHEGRHGHTSKHGHMHGHTKHGHTHGHTHGHKHGHRHHSHHGHENQATSFAEQSSHTNHRDHNHGHHADHSHGDHSRADHSHGDHSHGDHHSKHSEEHVSLLEDREKAHQHGRHHRSKAEKRWHMQRSHLGKAMMRDDKDCPQTDHEEICTDVCKAGADKCGTQCQACIAVFMATAGVEKKGGGGFSSFVQLASDSQQQIEKKGRTLGVNDDNTPDPPADNDKDKKSDAADANGAKLDGEEKKPEEPKKEGEKLADDDEPKTDPKAPKEKDQNAPETDSNKLAGEDPKEEEPKAPEKDSNKLAGEGPKEEEPKAPEKDSNKLAGEDPKEEEPKAPEKDSNKLDGTGGSKDGNDDSTVPKGDKKEDPPKNDEDNAKKDASVSDDKQSEKQGGAIELVGKRDDEKKDGAKKEDGEKGDGTEDGRKKSEQQGGEPDKDKTDVNSQKKGQDEDKNKRDGNQGSSSDKKGESEKVDNVDQSQSLVVDPQGHSEANNDKEEEPKEGNKPNDPPKEDKPKKDNTASDKPDEVAAAAEKDKQEDSAEDSNGPASFIEKMRADYKKVDACKAGGDIPDEEIKKADEPDERKELKQALCYKKALDKGTDDGGALMTMEDCLKTNTKVKAAADDTAAQTALKQCMTCTTSLMKWTEPAALLTHEHLGNSRGADAGCNAKFKACIEMGAGFEAYYKDCTGDKVTKFGGGDMNSADFKKEVDGAGGDPADPAGGDGDGNGSTTLIIGIVVVVVLVGIGFALTSQPSYANEADFNDDDPGAGGNAEDQHQLNKQIEGYMDNQNFNAETLDAGYDWTKDSGKAAPEE